MKNQISKYGFMLILFWYLTPLVGQSQIESKAIALFDTPITWVKNFEGFIDGVHHSTLCVAFDGVNCKGYMNYTSSNVQYLLEGTLQNEKMILLEKFNNEPSGYVNGTFSGDDIQLEWKSINEDDSYGARFEKIKKEQVEKHGKEILVLSGFLDEQSIKMILRHDGAGSFLLDNGKTEKLFSAMSSDGSIQVENLTAGYTLRLVNTKEDHYEASFILPGAKMASHLRLRQLAKLDIQVKEYLSHSTKSATVLPVIDAEFDQELKSLIADWKADMLKHQSEPTNVRFKNVAKIWFDIETYNSEYISGVLHYNSSWARSVQSKSFTYNRKQKEMVSLVSFLKGSAKWERAVKERMLAAKNLNSITEKDYYEKWIEKASLIEPVLCEGGLQFFTEPNIVFGQASTFMPWKSLTPLVMSTSKLNKLRKIK